MIAHRIYEVAKKKLTGEYGKIVTAAVDLIVAVEGEFQFDSGVMRVYVWPYAEGGTYYDREQWVVSGALGVPDVATDSRCLREYVYHELGHAICDGFDIRSYLMPFIRKQVPHGPGYEEAVNRASCLPRLSGFVSGYARLDREEDFCETLSAYLCNRRTWRRKIRFNEETISVHDEPRLLRRLEAVHVALRELKGFE